ncbi:MAG: hypothetical protein FWJ34_01330 [Geminocystis sp. GBBB08]|nr:hypothetical protein [Geminocystis sp. GBBB08]
MKIIVKTKVNEEEILSRKEREKIEVVKELYRQQLQMYSENKQTIENRIVSIEQPHIRPIVRGKARVSVEFGAKISVSYVEGYIFLDYVGRMVKFCLGKILKKASRKIL